MFEFAIRPAITDAPADGRVRLDAIARWLQDAAYADVVDTGFDRAGVWIVRRQRVRVEAFPRFGEPVSARTFCSGLGRFSAERRTVIHGAGGHVDAVATWVWLDERGRPGGFEPDFLELYTPSAGSRPAPTRLTHPGPPPRVAPQPWFFRAADIDVAGHVNNSHYWEPLEEDLTDAAPASIDVEIEHREPAHSGPAEIVRNAERLWVRATDGTVHASLQVLARD